METSLPTTDRFTLTLIARPADDKNEKLSTAGRELLIGAAPACGKRPEGQQVAEMGLRASCTELQPFQNCRTDRRASDSTEPAVPPRAGGGTPDSLPSKDGRPQQQNRQAEGQKAN